MSATKSNLHAETESVGISTPFNRAFCSIRSFSSFRQAFEM